MRTDSWLVPLRLLAEPTISLRAVQALSIPTTLALFYIQRLTPDGLVSRFMIRDTVVI